MAVVLKSPAAALPLMWGRVGWFVLVHAGGVGAIAYMTFVHYSSATAAMAWVLFFLVALSITVDAHRFGSHFSFVLSKVAHVFCAVHFAGALQNTLRWWELMHRRHHAYEDTELDPYTVRHGFWWAHMGWLLRDSDAYYDKHAPVKTDDLDSDPVVVFFEVRWRYYVAALAVGLGLPTALSALWGDHWGGLLVGGFLRLVVQYHTTWAINSVVHYFGENSYAPGKTARSMLNAKRWQPLMVVPWVVLSILTVGEACAHDRHHKHANDPSIDPRWWAPDVGKWVIGLLAFLGLATKKRAAA